VKGKEVSYFVDISEGDQLLSKEESTFSIFKDRDLIFW